MSLAQIGEFSFIIAALGLSLSATARLPLSRRGRGLGDHDAHHAVADPRVGRRSRAFVDRKLPHALQTFAALYGSWLEQLRATSEKQRAGAVVRRLLRLLLLDAVVLAVIVIVGGGDDPRHRRVRGGPHRSWARRSRASWYWAASRCSASPFCIGIVRIARRLGLALADRALPERDGQKIDLAAAPRRALIVTLQLAIVLLVGTPLVALTQPFLPGAPPIVPSCCSSARSASRSGAAPRTCRATCAPARR